MAVVVDTTFLVDLSRQKKKALDAWRRLVELGQSFLVPSPALVEYLAGAKESEPGLEAVLAGAEIVSLGQSGAVAAGALASRALREGAFPGWMDLLIAGVAEERGKLPIVTANPKHFPYSETIAY